jgi:hypothetical protein
MLKRKFFSGALGAALVLWLGLADTRAQTYGVDYLSFQGTGVVLDNPTSPACQSINVNPNNVYGVIYRWTANPTLVTDALSIIIGDHAISRLVSTQGPNFSLNGTSTISWTFINRHADFGNNILPSTATMSISTGLGAPVSLAAGNIKIVNGNIPFFPANGSGCTVTNFHAALVAIPN